MNEKPNDHGYRLAVRIAAVAGILAIVVCALLLYDYSQRRGKDPSDSATLQAFQNAIAQKPTNEALKVGYRDLDLESRRIYFRQRAFAHVGAGLLLVAVAVFLAAAKTAATLHRRMPTPNAPPVTQDREAVSTRTARWAVGGVCFAMVGVAIVLSVGGPSELPTVPEETAAVPEPPPSEEEIAKAWPRFRGPGGLGISAYTNVPETWDASSGEGIVWKTPVPLPGNNSPIVWGNRVFLSGADKQRREVYCFDAQSGELLWQQVVPGTPASTARPPTVINDTGYAAPTTATDGRRVFAIFANGDLAAFDFSGKLAWSKSFGFPNNAYGHASSLAMWQNLLLVQLDQGAAGDVKLLLKRDQRSASALKSKLLAFDSATGKSVWEVNRPVPNSWASPIVIRQGDRAQIITAADPWVIAYNPADGAELWRAKCLNVDIGPSPAFAAGRVFVANETSKLSALRAESNGDVTGTGVLWTGEDGMPDTCSPLATKDYVLLLTSFGTLTCYDAAKGDMLWSEDFEGDFTASPGLAGNRLYLVSKQGKTYVVEPGPQNCKRLGEANLGEECVTSPAFQEGRIYLRGKNHLFCIGEK